ncbi:hypothetical protein PP182_19230 [Maribacter sp. PR1]|uniref:DUF4440 domain-containing protein n=1 Tax=Maribacter cobaltidurans TaxID=1178778 RepID=A0ABU7IZ06_9FLAO|nr:MULTISPECIES: hypothetical protein [Maribacter]MDC6390827.1 hypothetical protein [Maribacter sp. PR1]MEE1978219.1 hypothetical protein [Maribacter cobaltidurans]
MKLFNFLLFLILANSSINGQNESIQPADLEGLYTRALNSRVDLILAGGWNYVELNEYGKRIKDLDVSDRYKFLTNKELIDLSIRKKKTINVYRVLHKSIAKDTIDINFGIVNVTAKRGIFFSRGIKLKKAKFNLSCGGTNGYQPDIRFVFNDEKKIWEIVYNRYISTSE